MKRKKFMLYFQSFVILLALYSALRFALPWTNPFVMVGVLVLSAFWFTYRLPLGADFLKTSFAVISASLGLTVPAIALAVHQLQYWETRLPDPDTMIIATVFLAMVEVGLGGLLIVVGACTAQFYRHRIAA